MNARFCYLLLILCFTTQITLAQNSPPQNSSVLSTIQAGEYPVDYYTGAPLITVPIYTMPTRSKDIQVGVSLDYHPSSIRQENKYFGNSGRGWNVMQGGVISIEVVNRPDELTYSNAYPSENNDLFHFNFMGFSGKFKVIKSADALLAVVIENSGSILLIDIIYHPTTFKISGFKFYDDKGYMYKFDVTDTYKFVEVTPNATLNYAFYLSEIVDNNNNVLASFSYTNYNSYNTIKMVNNIDVPGFGSISFEPSYNYNKGFQSYNNIIIKDFFNNTIKKFQFYYDLGYSDDGDILNNNEIRLESVKETLINNAEGITYGFYYRDSSLLQPLNEIKGYDKWGYPNNTSKWCAENEEVKALTDTKHCARGILEKMTMSTGASIIYKYESNTYSFEGGVPMDGGVYDASLKTVLNGNAGFYTNQNNLENRHNSAITPLRSQQFTNISRGNIQFTITNANTDLYFKIDADKFPTGFVLDGQPLYDAPVFYLRANGSATNLFTFNYANNYGNDQNNCKGKKYTFQPGTYSIIMSSSQPVNAFIAVNQINASSIVNKFYNGGGVRIKKIGYFNTTGVPQNFYDLEPSSPEIGGVTPIRELSYDYSLPGDNSISSGAIGTDGGLGNDLVRYKFVTVYDSQSNGRVEYNYFSAIDYPSEYVTTDYRFGKIMGKKIIGYPNTTLEETSYLYTTTTSAIQNNQNNHTLRTMGWIMPSEISTTQYFQTDTFNTKDKFTYNTLRQLAIKETSTSTESETLFTRYYYHAGATPAYDVNSIYSKNRISEIDHVDSYLNTELTSSNKIIYSKVWNNPHTSAVVNVAYLPQQIQVAQGTNELETVYQTNLYDQYGHQLEVQQTNGIKKAFIWGYNNSQIIAEIENASYGSIPILLITEAQTASNSSNEAALLTKLDNIRNSSALANSFITTYTYKPLLGKSSAKDSRGYQLTYEYDLNGILKLVKDQDGNILSENQYHTANQN
jgi:hypothetical protein